jgi:hypothetical protein
MTTPQAVTFLPGYTDFEPTQTIEDLYKNLADKNIAKPSLCSNNLWKWKKTNNKTAKFSYYLPITENLALCVHYSPNLCENNTITPLTDLFLVPWKDVDISEFKVTRHAHYNDLIIFRVTYSIDYRDNAHRGNSLFVLDAKNKKLFRVPGYKPSNGFWIVAHNLLFVNRLYCYSIVYDLAKIESGDSNSVVAQTTSDSPIDFNQAVILPNGTCGVFGVGKLLITTVDGSAVAEVTLPTYEKHVHDSHSDVGHGYRERDSETPDLVNYFNINTNTTVLVFTTHVVVIDLRKYQAVHTTKIDSTVLYAFYMSCNDMCIITKEGISVVCCATGIEKRKRSWKEFDINDGPKFPRNIAERNGLLYVQHSSDNQQAVIKIADQILFNYPVDAFLDVDIK